MPATIEQRAEPPPARVYTAPFPSTVLASGLVLLAAASVVLVTTGAAVAGEVLLVAVLAACARLLLAVRVARRVELTGSTLTAWSTVGRARTVPWESVSELVLTPSLDAPARVRLLSREHSIVMTRALSSFEELCAELRALAPNALVSRGTLLRR